MPPPLFGYHQRHRPSVAGECTLLVSGHRMEAGVRSLKEVRDMSVIIWVLAVIIWVLIAFWPARVAGRKGHSFIGFFIFSLVFFPAALIVAYLVRDRRRGVTA